MQNDKILETVRKPKYHKIIWNDLFLIAFT